MNAASAAMAGRATRQSGRGDENGVERRVQLKGIRVDCADADSAGGLIAVEIEFLERFDGVVYSKGRHDDPNCMWVPRVALAEVLFGRNNVDRFDGSSARPNGCFSITLEETVRGRFA